MSTDEYVPSDTDVRSVWVVHERDCGWAPHPGDPSAEFDRFIARVRREAKAEALREAASAPIPRDALASQTRGWLRTRAYQIETGEQS